LILRVRGLLPAWLMGVLLLFASLSWAGEHYVCQKCGVGTYGQAPTGNCSRGGFHEPILTSEGARYTCRKCSVTSGSVLTGSCSQGGFHENMVRN